LIIFQKRVFLGVVVDSINAAASRGILVKILEHEEPKVLYTRLAFHAGDNHAQHEINLTKCGCNVMHSCIRSMCKSRDGTQYDSKKDILSVIIITEPKEEGAKKYQKHLNGVNTMQQILVYRMIYSRKNTII